MGLNQDESLIKKSYWKTQAGIDRDLSLFLAVKPILFPAVLSSNVSASGTVHLIFGFIINLAMHFSSAGLIVIKVKKEKKIKNLLYVTAV